MYWAFNFRLTAGDLDYARMSFTDDSGTGHDSHNTAAKWNGCSHYQDGGTDGGYGNNKDSSLSGNEGNLSIWVRE